MEFTKYKEKVEYGDTIIVYLSVQFIYAVRIESGKVFQTSYGALRHDDVVGKRFGCKVNCSKGWAYILFPTPELWTLTLPHRTQIIYTPDISLIITQLDIKPGSVVCEAGTGSGSLSHALARTIAPNGHLYSCDFHEVRAGLAEAEMIAHGLAAAPDQAKVGLVSVRHRDVCHDGFGILQQADAVFLDLPSPWLVVAFAVQAIRLQGGRLCSFSPCMEQVQKMANALRNHGFSDITTMECIQTQYSVKDMPFPPLRVNKKKPQDDRDDATKQQEGLDVKDTTGSDGDARTSLSGKGAKRKKLKSANYMTVTVPPVTQPGHTGYLTFATLTPR